MEIGEAEDSEQQQWQTATIKTVTVMTIAMTAMTVAIIVTDSNNNIMMTILEQQRQQQQPEQCFLNTICFLYDWKMSKQVFPGHMGTLLCLHTVHKMTECPCDGGDYGSKASLEGCFM